MTVKMWAVPEVLCPPGSQGVGGEVSEGHHPGLPLLLGSLQRVHSSNWPGDSKACQREAKLLFITEIEGFMIFFYFFFYIFFFYIFKTFFSPLLAIFGIFELRNLG